MEASEAHDENGTAHAAEPTHGTTHEAAAHRKTSRLGSTASAVLGLVIVAGAVVATVMPDHPLVQQVVRLGVKPNVAMIGGFGLLLLGLVLVKLENLAGQIATVGASATQLADNSGHTEMTADAVVSRIEPTMITVSQQAQQISEQVAAVETAVSGFAGQSEKAAASLDEQRRQHLTMATALDALGKSLDKGIEKIASQRPTMMSPSSSSASSPNSDMLTPITKALDDLARDQTSRAAKMHASMREMSDSLKGSVAPLEASAKAAIEQASKQMLESMSKTIESMTKSMETISKSLEARSKVVESKLESLEEKISAMQASNSESKEKLSGLGSLEALTTQVKQQAHTVEGIAKSVAEIRMSISSASTSSSTSSTKGFDAMAAKLDRLATQLANVLDGQSDAPSNGGRPAPAPAAALPVVEEELHKMSTGPKESTTILSAIDRLRRLRTND